LRKSANSSLRNSGVSLPKEVQDFRDKTNKELLTSNQDLESVLKENQT